MSTVSSPDDETERDPWLTEALRHAPDAEAAPPAALSDAILREARASAGGVSIVGAAARPTPDAPARSATTALTLIWAAAWAWLLRPSVAGSFATLLVAVLVGVMWQGRSPEETLGRAPAADASPAAAAAAAPIASMPALHNEAARQAEEPAVLRSERATGAAPASAPAPSGSRPSATQARRDLTQPSAPVAAPPTPKRDDAATDTAPARPAPSRPAPQAAPAESDSPLAARSAQGPAPAPAPAPSPSTATATEPAPAPASAQALAPRTDSAAAPSAALRRRESAPTAPTEITDADANSADGRSAKAGAVSRSVAKAAPTRSNDFDALRAAIDADPGRWHWRRGEATQPMTPALRGWLAQLAAATASRWRHEPEPAAFDDAAPLELYREGSLAATLRLNDIGVRLDGGWQAALTPDQVAGLRRALEVATR